MKSRLVFSLLFLTVSVVAVAQKKQDSVAEKGLVKITILYPFAEGKTFNMEYYESTHMPMVAKFIGPNLVKYTIEKGIASGQPNPTLPYMAIGAFYVKSLEQYQAAIGPNIEAIRADIPKYTNIAPIILVSEVIR